jgi:hypothetical protein
MWHYPATKIDNNTGFGLRDLRERAQAADQLGYNVELRVERNSDITVFYVKRAGEPPRELQ